MRTIIAGSRTCTDYAAVQQACESCGWEITTVLSGGARGVDKAGEVWADLHGVPIERYPADWSAGRGAGIVRNNHMAGRADALIAVWDGVSRGTRSMIVLAKQSGLMVHVHRVPPHERRAEART